MGRIEVLAPRVQGQIAAGEVIERPASVVKELVENAIDAGARQIDVTLADGGMAAITVRDDGSGMSPAEAELAFARHATSKLRVAEDLERVPTFGFRGEALPSIAAAGRIVLTTRGWDVPEGVTVEADGDGVRGGPPVGMAPGTRVEVQQLFEATPARRKFLRRPATELGHVVEAVTRLAVAHPTVGVRVQHEERTVLDLPRVADLGQRLHQVLGRERASALVPVEGALGEMGIAGFVGPPRDSLSSARLVWTYIAVDDGSGASAPRWIRDRVLLRAVLDGYDTFLMRGRYPIAVVVLRVPPGTVDVNVHPAKLEVRFRDTRPVHRLVSERVRAALTGALATKPDVSASPPGAVGGSEPAVTVLHGAALAFDSAAPAETQDQTPGQVLRQPGLWRAAPEGFRSLRFVAQVFAGYLLCDGGDRLVLIDQHAAHERVLFDRLVEGVSAGELERDPLLVPETITLAATEVAALAEHAELLERAGLEGEPFGGDTYLLRSVPRLLAGRNVATIVRALAEDLASTGVSRAPERMVESVLATVACHSATRVGQRLDATEADALLAQMDEATVNAHCPHGRPVAVQLARTQVEALFGR